MMQNYYTKIEEPLTKSEIRNLNFLGFFKLIWFFEWYLYFWRLFLFFQALQFAHLSVQIKNWTLDVCVGIEQTEKLFRNKLFEESCPESKRCVNIF